MSETLRKSRIQIRQIGPEAAFLVAACPGGRDACAAAGDAYARLGEALDRGRWEVVQERVFGSLDACATILRARQSAWHAAGVDPNGPYSFLQGCPTVEGGYAGTILRAVPRGAGVRPLLDGKVARGRTWTRGGAHWAILQNILGTDPEPGSDGNPAAAADRMFQQAQRILTQNGWDYGQTVRTWLYLSKILSWYGELNQVRNALYCTWGLMASDRECRCRPPASTGIGADPAEGAVCAMDLLAFRPAGTEEVSIRHLSNPGQGEAYWYGSAFARGVAIEQPGHTLIEISGTAAIDEMGASLHLGDVRAQVNTTLDKVSSLIAQEGATLADIAAASLFVKRAEHAAVVREVLAERGLADMPAVMVVADVCRDELLFEIDGEAVVAKG